MEQDNRYNRYQDDNNRSSDYRRRQYDRERDFDDSWDNDQRSYERQRSYSQSGPGYNSQRGDFRSGQHSGNDWRENNWRTGESNSYRSAQDYDNMYGNYGPGYGYGSTRENRPFNRNYEDRNPGWNIRSWGDRDPDRNYDRNYNDRGDYDRNNRDWWDRTSDEVSSWFGDDDAKRRRHMDRITKGSHYGKGPKNYKRSAEKIKEDVNERLSDDHELDASNIEVEVSGTEVTLAGTVDSRHSKRRAEDLAEWVSGVSNVQNNLKVSINVDSGTSSYSGGSEGSKGTTKSNQGASLTNSRTKEQHLHN